MQHETWEIPAEQQRPVKAQNLDDLKFTLYLWWCYMIGPFVKPPVPLLEGSDPKKIPVIIVPGFICRPAIYTLMQKAIHAAGYPCHILAMGYQISNVYEKGRKLSEYITQIGAKEVYVVAHSMGGLIVTSCLYAGEKRIRHAWTLGAPIWGTNVVFVVYGLVLLILACNLSDGWGLYLLFAGFFLSPALRQMIPSSDFLRFTSAKYDEMQNVTSVFCSMDTIVFHNLRDEPGSSSRFRRESDVLFPEAGHNNIAMGQNGVDCLVRALEAKNSGAA